MLQVLSFTFGTYKIDKENSRISFTYHVEFEKDQVKTYTDTLLFENIPPESWDKVPAITLQAALQALLLMLGINYWTIFPTKNIRIEGFALSREQAQFWNEMYLHGLAEFFYRMQMDFEDLISFPYDESITVPFPIRFERPVRALLLNGAGKDSVLSAEMLKAQGKAFDYFSFSPSPAHERIAQLVEAKTIRVRRHRDFRAQVAQRLRKTSTSYPSVSTFTFVAVLLAELLGYDSIIFSNERSADIGNLTYRGLPVNHQWCKSSKAEKLKNDYITRYITSDIQTKSLLREFSELEIMKRFVQYPKYFRDVTSCNSYFWLTPPERWVERKPYWCKECPKCVFLFACFSAFLPRKEVLKIFGADLYKRKRLLPLFKSILGIEGFKPLDCVGEPEEMILAMHYASKRGEYKDEFVMKMFENSFPANYPFDSLEQKVFNKALNP